MPLPILFIIVAAVIIFIFSRPSLAPALKFLATFVVLVATVLALVLAPAKKDEKKTTITDNKPIAPKNSPWDSSVYQVETYLDDNLKDPDSFEAIEWSKVVAKPGSDCPYSVRCKYRAKKSFGGYVIANQIFCMSDSGDVISVKDLD